ncbi:hypothetical protein GTA08_BOTSDO07529 [Neofusicoccum parvum]|uniref:Uncharacterized protein n=1 Tax=Neofusicoccum parvum TaxID=310453 RepID=A0ACB5RUN8_9PEZI|nr:hypothetical protein GTA08_BOTSDO07529 [Neofusicoccum parvum]GME49657.1 hypothetical protein GTA08_BOTSDO07529 [Neofusicoccum parvum]
MESKLSEFENWKKSVLEKTPQDSPSKRALRKELLEKDDLARNNWSRRPFLREKARQLIAKEAGAMAPSLDEHPAFCNQHVRLREKNYSTKTDVPKCWRPGKSRDEELRGCCERNDVICEDCGFVLCADCGSRCRGEDWCVVEGCVRCQTRLGVNICTPHLRELRAIPVSSFHGHLVEQSALDLIENL